MSPWQHAKSSAGKNGTWLDDLPIHEFMDSTKAACPDLRHRMILHNADLGPELAARVFPDRPDARDVALQHVAEDLGWTPTLTEWIDGCDPVRMPRPISRRLPLDRGMLASQLARNQHLRDDDQARAVLDLLLLPTELAGLAALPVLLNGFGTALTRLVFGPPRELPGLQGGRAIFDAAYVAEAIAHWVFGVILPLPDVLAAVHQAPVTTKVISRG